MPVWVAARERAHLRRAHLRISDRPLAREAKQRVRLVPCGSLARIGTHERRHSPSAGFLRRVAVGLAALGFAFDLDFVSDASADFEDALAGAFSRDFETDFAGAFVVLVTFAGESGTGSETLAEAGAASAAEGIELATVAGVVGAANDAGAAGGTALAEGPALVTGLADG